MGCILPLPSLLGFPSLRGFTPRRPLTRARRPLCTPVHKPVPCLFCKGSTYCDSRKERTESVRSLPPTGRSARDHAMTPMLHEKSRVKREPTSVKEPYRMEKASTQSLLQHIGELSEEREAIEHHISVLQHAASSILTRQKSSKLCSGTHTRFGMTSMRGSTVT